MQIFVDLFINYLKYFNHSLEILLKYYMYA